MEWSPFEPTRLACAASQHFGIVGNGRLYVLEVTPQGISVLNQFDTRDGLYDCSWSEENDRHLVTGSGDGSVKLWDATQPARPLCSFDEHSREVYAVDWNLVSKGMYLAVSLFLSLSYRSVCLY